MAYGKERNVAWRVLDAKYFGLPQQRRRVYLLGDGKKYGRRIDYNKTKPKKK